MSRGQKKIDELLKQQQEDHKTQKYGYLMPDSEGELDSIYGTSQAARTGSSQLPQQQTAQKKRPSRQQFGSTGDHRIKVGAQLPVEGNLKLDFKYENLFAHRDNVMCQMGRNSFNDFQYELKYTAPAQFTILNQPHVWNTSVYYSKDLKVNKFLSRERTIGLKTQYHQSPWQFKVECAQRENFIDKHNSKSKILRDIQMSEKLSFGCVYNKFNPNAQLFKRMELEYNLNSPQFVKVDCQRAQRFDLNYNKMSFSYNLHCGMIKTISSLAGSKTLKTNDRLYLAKSHCFSSLGHTKPNNLPVSKNIHDFENEFYGTEGNEGAYQQQVRKQKKNVSKLLSAQRNSLGNDLGSTHFLNLFMTLDFVGNKWLCKHNIRPFLFSNLVFYPPVYDVDFRNSDPDLLTQVMRYTRGGLGFGLSIPIPKVEYMRLHLYHNLLTFNSKDQLGDIARNGVLEIEFALF